MAQREVIEVMHWGPMFAGGGMSFGWIWFLIFLVLMFWGVRFLRGLTSRSYKGPRRGESKSSKGRDLSIQDQILRLIGRLVEERGTSIILISHALGAVKGLVDKVYVMYAGNMVEVAPTEELFSDPLHPYTRNLFKTVPKLTGGRIPEAIKGRIPNYINPPEGCRFSPRCEHAMPICMKEIPSPASVGGGREVACFLYK